MRFKHFAVIHAVKLVTAKDEDVIAVFIVKVTKVFPNSIGGTFEPSGLAFHRLLGSKQFDKTTTEIVETVGLADVLVKRDAEKLSNDVDSIDTAVEAVADGDVNKSVFRSQRHSRLGTDLGQREKTGATTTTKNQRDYFPHIGKHNRASLSTREQQQRRPAYSNQAEDFNTKAKKRVKIVGMNEARIQKTTAADLLEKLIRYDSVSDKSNESISRFVADQLEDLGFGIEWHTFKDANGINKVSIVAKREGQGRTEGTTRKGGVVYMAHTDVVPVDDWSTGFSGPFEATLRNERIYGRGSCDMKGSLAAALIAASKISESNQKAPLYFIVTADEEIGMKGAKQVDRESAWFQEMIERDTVGIIGEPTELKVVHGHKGAQGYIVRARGISAHTSTSEGVNANYQLIPALGPLLEQRNESESNPKYRNSDFEPATLSWNMVLINEPTAINVTTSHAEAQIFIRPMPGVDHSPLEIAVRRIAADHGLELIGKDGVLPWGVSPSSEWVQTMLRLTGEHSSQTVCYATDGGVLQRLKRLLVCGPGSIEQAHRKDEWISLDQLHRGVDLYERAFREWAGSSS